MLVSHIKIILTVLTLGTLSGLLVYALAWLLGKKPDPRTFCRRWLFFIYLAGVFALTLLPLPKAGEFLSAYEPHVILRPFAFVTRIKDHLAHNPWWHYTYLGLGLLREDVVTQPLLNVVLMLPFGMYLRGVFRWSVGKIILASFFLSLTIELLQLTGLLFYYPQPYRLFEVDDLLMNTLGGALGALLIAKVPAFAPHKKARRIKKE